MNLSVLGAANDAAAEVCFTCRTVLSALTQGSIVGVRYEILSPLGRGAEWGRSTVPTIACWMRRWP